MLDPTVADAYIVLSTSTSRVMPQGITPVSPINQSTSSSPIIFSGTYRDPEGIFNRIKIDVEATTTFSGGTTSKRFDIPRTVGEAIPFSLPLDLSRDVTTGMRWRVQAWSTTDWGDGGYDTQWNGTTGFSEWQYFTYEPASTSTVVTSTPPTTSTSTPAQSSEKTITAFSISTTATTTVGAIDETNHTINLTVPFGTDVRALVPTITVSPFATSSPASGLSQDLASPVVYTVTAQDGSIQTYTVTVVVAPDPAPPVAEVVMPTILSYTFNGTASDLTMDATTTTALIALTANKNVDWTSVKIEDQNDPTRYKIFYSDKSECVDGTATCAKTWAGNLSHGSVGPDAAYRIKVNMKDAQGNVFDDYLAPYNIIYKQVIL